MGNGKIPWKDLEGISAISEREILTAQKTTCKHLCNSLLSIIFGWWEIEDLNLRPLACQASALAN